MVVLVVFLGGMTEGEKVSRRPVKMWEAFHCVYVQQQAGTCFNAYDALFNIRKEPDEMLQLLISWVTTPMQLFQNLCSSDDSRMKNW